MSDNTHVPDKLEGYMLQVRHALYELICLDERVVSVEAYPLQQRICLMPQKN